MEPCLSIGFPPPKIVLSRTSHMVKSIKPGVRSKIWIKATGFMGFEGYMEYLTVINII